MKKLVTLRSTRLTRLIGALMLAVGLVWGAATMVAGQQIGDLIWKLRGYPYDLGPELLFWARRGPVAAALLCAIGGALLYFARTRRSG